MSNDLSTNNTKTTDINLYESHNMAYMGQTVSYTTDDLIKIAEDYIADCYANGHMPTIEGFVIKLKVSPSSWHKCRANSAALIELTDFILLHQRDAIIQSGLKAKNPRFHEFMMKAIHKVFDIPDEVRELNQRILADNPEIIDRLEGIEKKLRKDSDKKKATYVDITDFEVSPNR